MTAERTAAPEDEGRKSKKEKQNKAGKERGRRGSGSQKSEVSGKPDQTRDTLVKAGHQQRHRARARERATGKREAVEQGKR